jgi:ABC-type glutathione transport system ATPase component
VGAVHAAPDILVIDEVLAVGDTRFRVKCYRRLAAMRDAGAAFVLVSHNPLAILSVCDSATYLSAGRVFAQGPPRSVVARYEEEMAGNGAAIPDGAAAAARSTSRGKILPPHQLSRFEASDKDTTDGDAWNRANDFLIPKR